MKLCLCIQREDNQLLAEVLRQTCPKMGLVLSPTAADAEVVITDSLDQLASHVRGAKVVGHLYREPLPCDPRRAFAPYAERIRLFDLAPNHGGASELAEYLRQLAAERNGDRQVN